MPPIEIELKFQLMPGSEAILRAGEIFGPAAQHVHQITTYHDTPDSLLFASGLTLRVRQVNDSFVQCVKSCSDGLGLASSRNEWEWPVANGTPDVGILAGVPELAAIAGQITGRIAGQITGRLRPIIVTDVWRTKRLLDLEDGAVAEASLDIGSVAAGATSEPICEIELELKHGPVAPLYRLATRFTDLAPMWISAQSKAARGWSLRNGHGGGAIVLHKPKIGKKVSVAAGLHRMIGAMLSQLTANIAPTLSGDPEALRQMRGALRHLRAVLRLFGPMPNRNEGARFDHTLHRFAQSFGRARDWDVFCLQTLPAIMADLPDRDWGDLARLAETKRNAAKAIVEDAIRGPVLTAAILDLALWSETCATKPKVIGTRRLNQPLSDYAPALLDAMARKARRAGRHPERLSMAGLHDFRKALDRLNAAIRFLGATYPAHAVAAYRKRSDAVRDIIGAANDAEVTKAMAFGLVAEGSPDFSASATALVAWAEQRQAHALTGLKPAARRFRTEPEFWQD